MSYLPLLSGRKIVQVLERMGYRVIRQRGSHMRLVCPGRKSITVPDHKVIGRGLLKRILRDAEISVAVFIKLFG